MSDIFPKNGLTAHSLHLFAVYFFPLGIAGRGSSSRIFVVISIAAAAICICCIVPLLWDSSVDTPTHRPVLVEVDAEKTPQKNPYCSIFTDSDDCDQQVESEASKYWSPDEIREKLWNTMKALAEVNF